MKLGRISILAIATVSTIAVSTLLNVSVSTNKFNVTYPSVVCQPNIPSLSTAISLSSPKTPIRKTGSQSMKFSAAGVRRYALASQSAVIDAGAVTPVVWQVSTGVWAGAVTCSAPVSSQWFVGATGDITSKGSLNLVNSGLGKAVVRVTVFSENGELTPRDIIIRANSYVQLPLPSLAPGSKSIAIHIQPKAGRVNGFVVDARGRGLRALGGDLINPTGDPVKTIQIPAIPQQTGKKAATPHTLRLLVPGNVDAHISAEIRSTDGTFSPTSLDGQVIAHKKVIEIPFDLIMASGKFALHITSDQPILGSVFSKTISQGKGDFVWSTSAPDLTEFTLATTGLAPTLVFTGKSIRLNAEVISTNGVSKVIDVRGQDIATLVLDDRTRAVTFTKISPGTSGAALISSKSGYGYIPLTPGSVLTKSSIPSSNIRVLNP